MPGPKLHGDRPAVTGDRQVPTLPTSKAEPPPIQVDRWFRNNRHPDAGVMNQMCGGVNGAMLFRTKEVFGMGTVLGQASGLPVSSTAGTRARFRFAFHLSPYSHALFCRAIMYPQSSGYTSDAYAKLTIFSDTAEATAVASAEFHYGNNPLQSSTVTGWQHLKVVDKWIEGLTANTTYYARVDDVDYGLIQSLAVGDLQSMTENYSGYLPQNFSSETQILDEYRSNLVAPLKTMWTRGGAKVLNWSVDAQASPHTNATQTLTNIVDSSSTTYSAAIPGFTLDMTGKARLSQSGVPCKIFAYLDSTSTNNGQLIFRNEAGTTSAAVDYLAVANTPQWFSTTVTMPDALDKWYLMSKQTTAAATVKVHAVSIIEYET